MPTWLLPIINWLIGLAIQYGIPWLVAKFPWLPANISKILQDLVDALEGHKATGQELKDQAKARIKSELCGTPPDLVG